MPRNAYNALKIANEPGKTSYHSTWDGLVYVHLENNIRSKDEVYENKRSNMIHFTLKIGFFLGDGSVSKECTSEKL